MVNAKKLERLLLNQILIQPLQIRALVHIVIASLLVVHDQTGLFLQPWVHHLQLRLANEFPGRNYVGCRWHQVIAFLPFDCLSLCFFNQVLKLFRIPVWASHISTNRLVIVSLLRVFCSSVSQIYSKKRFIFQKFVNFNFIYSENVWMIEKWVYFTWIRTFRVSFKFVKRLKNDVSSNSKLRDTLYSNRDA